MKNRYKKVLVTLISIAALVAIGLTAAKFMRSQRFKDLLQPKTQITQTIPKPELNTYSGQRVRFSYQAAAKFAVATDPKNETEKYVITGQDPGSGSATTLTIRVRPFANGGLSSDADYALRKQQSTLYVAAAHPAAVGTATLFTRTSGAYEKSLFWLHKGSLLSIVLSGSSQAAPALGNEFTVTLDSLAWL